MDNIIKVLLFLSAIKAVDCGLNLRKVLGKFPSSSRPRGFWLSNLQKCKCKVQDRFMCPEAHPWAYDGGYRCCSSSERLDGGPMHKHAPKYSCGLWNWVWCLDGRKRRTRCRHYKGVCAWQNNRGRAYPGDVVVPELLPEEHESLCTGESMDYRRLMQVQDYKFRAYKPGMSIKITPQKRQKFRGRGKRALSNDCLTKDYCRGTSTGNPKFFWLHLEHTTKDTGTDLGFVPNWLNWAETKKSQHNYCAQTGVTSSGGATFVGAHVLYYDSTDCKFKIGILKTSKTCNSKGKGGVRCGGSASLGCAIYCAGEKGSDIYWAKNFRDNLIKQFQIASGLQPGVPGYGYTGNYAYWKCDTIAERLDLTNNAQVDKFANQFVGPDGWVQSSSFASKAKEVCRDTLHLC